VVGSFLSAYSFRAVRGKSVSKGRSVCPRCKKKIIWYDNIPLLSFLLLSGKCRNCKKKISLRYPLIELGTAFVFAFIAGYYYQCTGGLLVSTSVCFWVEGMGLLAIPYLIFISVALMAIFITDIEKQMIPDELSYSLFSITFIALIISSPEDLYLRLFTGFFLSLSFLFLHLITLGRGMGLGDVKLVLFAGIFFGFKLSVVWVFTSFVLGAIIGVILILLSKAKFGKQIAFGPFLIVSFFLIILFGDTILTRLFPYL
jgi:prepilin signal peptidase PulO-like enzyme (type II secretory pathway)